MTLNCEICGKQGKGYELFANGSGFEKLLCHKCRNKLLAKEMDKRVFLFNDYPPRNAYAEDYMDYAFDAAYIDSEGTFRYEKDYQNKFAFPAKNLYDFLKSHFEK